MNRKPGGEPAANISRSCTSKPKSRKYDESHLSLGFTSVIISSEERPQCVLCLRISAADSMKPNKLKRHLETKHSGMKCKPEEYFIENLTTFSSGKKSFVNTTTVSSRALLASYEVSHRTGSRSRSLEL
jgi:hypothetical protein